LLCNKSESEFDKLIEGAKQAGLPDEDIDELVEGLKQIFIDEDKDKEDK
jgi:hypothetical protein